MARATAYIDAGRLDSAAERPTLGLKPSSILQRHQPRRAFSSYPPLHAPKPLSAVTSKSCALGQGGLTRHDDCASLGWLLAYGRNVRQTVHLVWQAEGTADLPSVDGVDLPHMLRYQALARNSVPLGLHLSGDRPTAPAGCGPAPARA